MSSGFVRSQYRYRVMWTPRAEAWDVRDFQSEKEAKEFAQEVAGCAFDSKAFLQTDVLLPGGWAAEEVVTFVAQRGAPGGIPADNPSAQ